MVGGLTPQAGRFRTVEVGVYSGKKLVHAGLSHKMVPGKVGELLAWVKGSNAHPLVSSCVFHYGLEFIHPFTDGNGRMGRYWQTALLAAWRPQTQSSDHPTHASANRRRGKPRGSGPIGGVGVVG